MTTQLPPEARALRVVEQSGGGLGRVACWSPPSWFEEEDMPQNSVGSMPEGIKPAVPQHKPGPMGEEPLGHEKPIWRRDEGEDVPTSTEQSGNYSDSRTHVNPSKGRAKMDPGAF